MTTRVWVPCDSAAVSVGADDVAAAIAREAAARGEDVAILRNGSRGLFWLEPLVEVETSLGRTGYGPVAAEDVAGLFDAGFLRGGEHRLGLGARVVISDWKDEYNHRRRHSALGYQTPAGYAATCIHR